MRKYIVVALSAAVLAACGSGEKSATESTSTSSGPLATARQQLSGHLTEAMKTAPVVGRMPAAMPLELTVGLQLKDLQGLRAAADAVADPKSPSYRHYLSTEAFGDAFGATPADYQKLLDWAHSKNLTVTPHANRFVASVSGAVSDIETALNVHMIYGLRPDGTQFFGPDAEPSIQLDVPVDHIGGLQDFAKPRAAAGSGGSGMYQGTDFRHAYASCTTLTGTGQTVGIYMSSGDWFLQSDITAYGKAVGQTYLPVQVVPSTVTSGAVQIEESMDIEHVLSMAPGAQVVMFTGSDAQILTNMAARTDIKQFSSSFTFYDVSATLQALLTELAMQGQSFFEISGDLGAWPSTSPPAGVGAGNVDIRAASDITIVGGTTLNMSGSGASYGTLETVWNQGGGWSSSGGIEPSVSIPSYQAGLAGKNSSSTSYRNVPDVAAAAVNVSVYENGAWSDQGGTSSAAPLWAGFMALVNQQAAVFGTGSVGFANPALYAIAATSAYATTFNDVASGCNTNPSGFQYCAGTGYDLTTGLGSPRCGLINALANYGEPGYGGAPVNDTSGVGTITGVNGLCVNLFDYKTANGTLVQAYTCQGTSNENWVLTRQGTIVGLGGGCLEIPDFNTTAGTKIDYWTCNGGVNQLWNAMPDGTIRGENGVCLTASATTSASALEVEPCGSGLATQKWMINGAAEIRGAANKCLELPDFATANGTVADYWTCNGGANQAWTWTAQGALMGENGKCLELRGGVTKSGTLVDYSACTGAATQVWTPGANGSIRGSGGLCLNLTSTATGTQLNYATCTGAATQSWVYAEPSVVVK